MTTCPYCKGPSRSTARAGCANCRRYAEAKEHQAKEEELLHLCRTYWALPYHWEADKAWMEDPKWLRGGPDDPSPRPPTSPATRSS